MTTVGELHDSLEPGESTYLRYAGITWKVTRHDTARRVEDEGQTPREMDEDRARDEADRDEREGL